MRYGWKRSKNKPKFKILSHNGIMCLRDDYKNGLPVEQLALKYGIPEKNALAIATSDIFNLRRL